MWRLWRGFALLAFGIVVGGCAASPWSSKRAAPTSSSTLTSSPAGDAAGNARNTASSASAQPALEVLRAVIAELEELRLEPAAQEKLLAELKSCDPTLWPALIQTVRAARAYRHRHGERAAGGAEERPTAGEIVRPSQGRPIAGQGVGDGEAPPTSPIASPSAVSSAAASPAALGHPPEGGVVPVSHQVSKPAEWRAALAEAIASMEAKLKAPDGNPSEGGDAQHAAQQAQLRMLYLLAGQREAALRPIPGVPSVQREFWSKVLFALDGWLDTQKSGDLARRAAETKQTLDEALCRLGEVAPLVVRNLAFCTEIQSYGCLKPFKENVFLPEQEVLLYAEVENFTSEPTPKGFHTALRSSYQIFDARGQRVAEQDFTVTEEYCQNIRRDFFIGYHLRMPKRIYPGKYVLQLTIEDVKSHKAGQSSLEFSIKDAGK